MSQLIQSPAAPNSRVMIITALITALTTIGVSFVGVVPQLRGGDVGTIKSLQSTISSLEKELEAVKRSGKTDAPAPPDKKKTIEGRVSDKDHKQGLSGVNLALLPTSSPPLMAETDANGNFVFSDIPSGTYSIIVLERDKKAVRTLLKQDGVEVTAEDKSIQYRYVDKGDK